MSMMRPDKVVRRALDAVRRIVGRQKAPTYVEAWKSVEEDNAWWRAQRGLDHEMKPEICDVEEIEGEPERWACLPCSERAGVVDHPHLHVTHRVGRPCPRTLLGFTPEPVQPEPDIEDPRCNRGHPISDWMDSHCPRCDAEASQPEPDGELRERIAEILADFTYDHDCSWASIRETADRILALEPLATLRAEVERLQVVDQGSADLCERCGWNMKFPNEPCRNCHVFALRARVEELEFRLRGLEK